jgi:AAT family amino acid transporter
MIESNQLKEEREMQRALSNRHVQLIAIGGTIGTGLFMGAGNSIKLTGPSILVVYAIAGFFMFMMMRAIGEMLYQDPSQHTFINFITKYVGRPAGYFAGWSYWISLIFVGMAEITAVAHYVQFWFPDWPNWAIQIGFLVVLSMVNLIAVKIFGEAEFWFAMIKIVAILALIVTGIMMVVTGFKAPNGEVASVANITSHFSLFPNGVFNFMIAFQMVFFAFQGMEFIGITTSETKNPRQILPRAINQMTIRILIFYIGALAVIMMIYNWHSLDPNQSPFVQVFQLAGIKWAAALVNFVVLTSASSALNAALYSTGRHLYQLGTETNNRFMKNFSSLSENGVPAAAILFSAGMILLSPVISSIPAISNAFTFVTSASSSVYLVIYILTMVAHWRFRKSQDFMPDGFKMPGYKIMNPLVVMFFIYVFVTLFMQQATIYAAVGGVIWVIVFGYLSHRKFAK